MLDSNVTLKLQNYMRKVTLPQIAPSCSDCESVLAQTYTVRRRFTRGYMRIVPISHQNENDSQFASEWESLSFHPACPPTYLPARLTVLQPLGRAIAPLPVSHSHTGEPGRPRASKGVTATQVSQAVLGLVKASQ